jgi:hypothetical protein
MGFHVEFPAKEGEGASLHKMGSHHGERSLVSVWKFLEKKMADHKIENGVAEKFQYLIRNFFGGGGLMDERFMGEGPIEPLDFLKSIIQTCFQLP